ncbi:MAG: Hsp70 family protein [Polaromonas sp.]|nr:Hsp70 family protein [Polaromonas sp.]
MSVIGFDFGTTNSLISIIQGDRVISFNDEQGLPIPSVVSYEDRRPSLVGKLGAHEQGWARCSGDLVRSPKTLLGKESVYVGGKNAAQSTLFETSSSLYGLKPQTRKVKNLNTDQAVVTIPVNMEGRRRSLLRDAFRSAGISIVQFVHESTIRKFDRKLVLVFDWGGGTLDLTLCRVVDGMLVQVGNDGTDEVGGDLFDEEIRNEVEKRVRAKMKQTDSVQVHEDARTRLMNE